MRNINFIMVEAGREICLGNEICFSLSGRDTTVATTLNFSSVNMHVMPRRSSLHFVKGSKPEDEFHVCTGYSSYFTKCGKPASDHSQVITSYESLSRNNTSVYRRQSIALTILGGKKEWHEKQNKMT